MKRLTYALLLVSAMLPAYLVGACSGGHAFAGSGGSSTTSPDAVSCTCSPALPAPVSFDDDAPHTLLRVTVPRGASMTVRTGFHGHLLAPGNELVAVVAYETWWGLTNVDGTAIVAAIEGSGGWGYVSETAVGVVTPAVDGGVVEFQATNATIAAWSPGTFTPNAPVTSAGATYLTPNGGTSTVAPVGKGGTGADGVTWNQIAATTTFTRTWQVTAETIETALAP